MSAAERVGELSTLLRRLGVPSEALHHKALAWIAADPEGTEAVAMWLRAVAGHPDEERAATLAGMLLAAGVPSPALDARVLTRISTHEPTTRAVESWACLIADYHLRRMLRRTGHPDAATLADTDAPTQTVEIGPRYLGDPPPLELWGTAMNHAPHSHAVLLGYLQAQLRAAHVEMGDLDSTVLAELVEIMGAEHTELLGTIIVRACHGG